MPDPILVLNAGSSSLKFALHALAAGNERVLCTGECTGIGDPDARLRILDADRHPLCDEAMSAASHETVLDRVCRWIDVELAVSLGAAAHRVVHGGARFAGPVIVDDTVLAALRELVPLAPLHQPHGIAGIEAVARLHPALPQVACFDTAFHHTQSALATTFALPRALTAQGIRRYGFHGLSYEFIAGVLPGLLGTAAAGGRIIIAHLGNGASLCALHEGRSVATTMGFTPLDGLPMGQRCGSLDPGVVLHLLQRGMSAAAVTRLLYHDSGLLGISGISHDMRTLLASSDPHAREAIELFVYRIGREIGSLAAALGGLDALVFTGGIGEHATAIRAGVCRAAAWLGLECDPARNAGGGPCISAGTSRVSAWVVPTDEDLMIARHARDLLGARQTAR